MSNNNIIPDNKQKTSTISFTLPKYITNLILPKCVMIHGEIVSSIYLQIALNINHSNKSLHWQKNGCWMQLKKLSDNTGYNQRTITKTLKNLEELKLIKIKKQGKLNVYSLNNNNLQEANDILNFNNQIEIHLLHNLNEANNKKYIGLFRELEKIINLNKDLVKGFWFNDINLLRDLILKSEKIYKGSSLFFYNNIAPHMFISIIKENHLPLFSLSENDRAIRIGSSQSTISRYINSYINAEFIEVYEGNINIPNKIGISPKILNDKNNEKSVVKVMSNEKMLICPICNKEFTENRSLSVHVSKTKDPQHILLNHLKKQTKCSCENLENLYLEYKNDFDELNNDNETNENIINVEQKDDYLKIECSCKMSCNECYKNWKSDFYDDCNHERKNMFIKEYNLNNNEQINKIKEEYNIVKSNKETAGKDTAPGLVKYFYDLVKVKCINWGKESAQVKNLLKKGITPDEIRITMDYLHCRGNIDLRFLNRSIQDALLEKKYINELEQEGTEAFLVKMYYDGIKSPINMQTLTRDVQKIKETMNTGLNYEQTKTVIQYMIDIKCPTLNFIGSKRTEALAKYKKPNVGKNNPSFFDRDDLIIIKNELINGRTNLRKINDKYKLQAKQIALTLFKDNGFSNKFTHFEWAWKVGLDLDEEMYQIAIKMQRAQEPALDKLLRDTSITEEQRAAILKIKDNFNKWLDEQTKNFEKIVQFN